MALSSSVFRFEFVAAHTLTTWLPTTIRILSVLLVILFAAYTFVRLATANFSSVAMVSTGSAFVGPISLSTLTQRNVSLTKINRRHTSLKQPVFYNRRITITNAASDKLTSTTEHSFTAAASELDVHPIVSTNFDGESENSEDSCIKSFDDIADLVNLVEECDFTDFRISHNGVTLEITREGGLGFDTDGCLKEIPSPPVDVPVQVPMSPQGMPAPVSQNAVSQNELDSYANEIAQSNGGVPTDEATSSVTNVDEKKEDPDKIYDTDFVVTSNRVGFFFSGAKNKPPLVNVDDTVAFNQPVCIIEQLGQQYVYLSEAAGRVVKILVEDGDPVEYGSQVMVIRPD